MGGHEGLLLVLNEAISRLENHSDHPGNQLIGKSLLASRIVALLGGESRRKRHSVLNYRSPAPEVTMPVTLT